MTSKTITVTGAYNISKLGGKASRKRAPEGENEPDFAGQKKALGAALLGHTGTFESWDIRGEIKRKLSGYRSQDVARDRIPASVKESPDEDGTIERLLACDLACYYCRQRMKVLYSKSRDPLQWTLDRIDNALSHTIDNTVVACMACNLKRRRQSADAFRDVKQMRIVRVERAESPVRTCVSPMHVSNDGDLEQRDPAPKI